MKIFPFYLPFHFFIIIAAYRSNRSLMSIANFNMAHFQDGKTSLYKYEPVEKLYMIW